MTDREHSPPAAFPSPFDQAVARRVDQLLAERGETVYDLAHYSRISVAALYRKLNGSARWSVADVGRIAGHFGLRPGELLDAGDDPAGPVVVAPRAATVPPALHPFSHAGSPPAGVM